MTEGVLVALISVLAAPIAVFITWMVNRKKHVADIYGVLASSSQSAVETMRVAMDALHEELIEANKKIDILQKEIVQLRHQNNLLLEENHILHDKVDELTKKLTN